MTRNEAAVEAARCLMCYDAPCTHACPTHIDIPKFIKKIATDTLRGSARTILESNLLGATWARVCPVQELCEGACVLGAEHKPIAIGRLQRHAMDFVSNNRIQLFQPASSTGQKVAIIGAGPAGLSCAGELAKRGHRVTLLDRKSTRLNSSHTVISYAVFCLKKKRKKNEQQEYPKSDSRHDA